MKRIFMTALSLLILLAGFAGQAEAVTQRGAPELLFIQTAEEAVITADPRVGDQYIMTLKNVRPHVAYFSDKPKRVAGKVSMEKFLARWSEGGDNSFKHQSPQAAFISAKSSVKVADKKAGDLVTLSKPKYNPKTQTLTYLVTPATQHINLKTGRHENPVLFIDEMSWSGHF